MWDEPPKPKGSLRRPSLVDQPAMTDQILITQVPARLQGVLGTEVRCTQHGLIAWVKTSLVGSVIAGHVMRFHSLKENGSSDRAIG